MPHSMQFLAADTQNASPTEGCSTPPKRRLPTKTRSGVISLPPKSGLDGLDAGFLSLGADDDAGLSPRARQLCQQPATVLEGDEKDEDLQLIRAQPARGLRLRAPCPTQVEQGSQMQATRIPSLDGSCIDGCLQGAGCVIADLGVSSPSPPASPSAHANPGAAQEASVKSSQQPALRVIASGGAASRTGGGKALTGPLNSSTSPVVVSLPVKRRGSYQSLKKSTINCLNSEDKPSVLALVRKPTHWEKFGTILVLYCAAHRDSQDDHVLQMMMAEGYDTDVVDNQADALACFLSKEVFPDMVIIDADHSYNTIQMIKQLQAQNPTVAVIVLGSAITRPGPTSALQAGAADYVRKPPDAEELMARIERHVQRQHCIKLELEKALDSVKNMMAQLAPASLVGDATAHSPSPPGRRDTLIAVAETDFEEQMAELNEENARLGAKLRDMERSLQAKDAANKELESQLKRIDTNADGYGKRLVQVETQSATLMHKVDELQQLFHSERNTPT